MKAVDPYAKIINFDRNGVDTPFTRLDGIGLLRKIEWAGRVSHRSEESQSHESYDRFLRAIVVGHGDWSITEHASITVDLDVDRGIQQEITRHRPPSYTIESTRFVNYAKKDKSGLPKMPARFIRPLEFKSEASRMAWGRAMASAEEHYLFLLECGEAPQIARDAFPLALGGRIIMTANLRMWRHFFLMRTTRECHPKMLQISIPLLESAQSTIPILFEDIQPKARQVDNMPKVETLWNEVPAE